MNQYRRIVSYLYKYANGKKGENTGFVRIDTRPEGIRLYFRIRDLRMMDEKRLKIYFYFHRENRLQLIFVDEFLCARGNCEYKKNVFPDFTDGDFEKMNGVVFLDQQGLFYGSCWDDRELSEELFEEREEEEKTGDGSNLKEEEIEIIEVPEIENQDDNVKMEETKQIEERRTDEVVVEREDRDERKGDNFVMSEFPGIKIYNPENAIRAVRIHIKDIPKLPPSEWKLADNAFLKQAYETEAHLLLGKIQMPNENEVWVLGVPGVYDNREKYLAGIFGFNEYIPLEEREYKTGGRGYWIRQIPSVE